MTVCQGRANFSSVLHSTSTHTHTHTHYYMTSERSEIKCCIRHMYQFWNKSWNVLFCL